MGTRGPSSILGTPTINMEKFGHFEVEALEGNIDELFLKEVVDSIEKIQKNKESLGSGRAADVYAFPEESFCIKEIKNDSWEYNFNDIHTEHELQQDAIEMGIRCPKLIMSIIDTDHKESKYLVMEKILGPSIKDIIEGKSPIPENFDEEKFWSKAKDMIKKMNNSNLYHRDLHSGNLMVEVETLEPVLIDFGHATHSFGEDDPYVQNDYPKNGELTRFPNDLLSLNENRKALSSVLTK